MRRAGVAALAFVVVAAVEIAVFVAVVKLVGLAWALLLVIATTVVGGWLLGREGGRGWRRFRAAVAEGRPPGREATDGLLGLVGALLLIVPGFLTDIAGLLLLAPPTRAFARAGVRRAAERRLSPGLAGDFFGPRRVRVRRGPAAPSPAAPSPPPQPPPRATTAIEGEIIDPARRPPPTGGTPP